jgi:hypothetical protein
MAGAAQRLPVRFVPKEYLIAFMRNNVVDNRRRGEMSNSLALGTKRMIQEKALPRSTPPGVVATAGC